MIISILNYFLSISFQLPHTGLMSQRTLRPVLERKPHLYVELAEYQNQVTYGISMGCPYKVSKKSSKFFRMIPMKGHSIYRVRTDLEKSLKMTLVLENSWNSKKMQFVLELSLNFKKISLIIRKSP